ncbi:YHS domain-containing protein [Actinotalea sp. M2MS4P-6]|uniref:YHS domain-containing protein n=1 Tax=Actinotalea sp. M2MS4P-6 TaxID=2983762 RepID=UPI0021E3E1E6|nr:YHS domain-containing protein [Actinotalea sp. M2MS4P-6]MCV2394661.1 YHS domain-containing protein [Actinotalea sp. M2MS4P-6]
MAETATDPVCGMSVDPATALSAEVDGTTYYFCAPGCRKAFLAEPSAYLGGQHGGHHAGEHGHGGHPS